MLMKKRVAAGLLAVIIALALSAALPAAAQGDDGSGPQLLSPSGPYPVGRTAYAWTDASRDEVHTDDPDDARELLVEVWYPAAPAPDAAPGPYMEPPMADLFNRMAGAPEGSVNMIAANAIPDAPLAEAQDVYPVVVFDPGFSNAPRQYSIIIEELASHGYVVFAPSHPYVTTMVVYPEGRVVEPINYNRLATLWAPQSVYDGEFEHVWVPDTTFVVEQIAALNAGDPQDRFAGRLAVDGYGMVGHSQGARTVAEVCLDDPACAGAISLDGGRSMRVDLSFDRPYMLFLADEGVQPFINAYDYGMEGLAADYYVLMIPRTNHGSFGDTVFWLPLIATGLDQTALAAGQYALLDYRLYIRSFFDKHVRGEDVPLLDGPAPEYPEVFFLLREQAIDPPTAGVEPQVAQAGAGGNTGTLDIGQADVWTYAGQAGETLTLLLLADRPADQADADQRVKFGLLDTVLVVRAPDGSLLAVNDDHGLTTNSQIEDLVLPEDGVYTIEVRSWENQNAGGYTLILRPGGD